MAVTTQRTPAGEILQLESVGQGAWTLTLLADGTDEATARAAADSVAATLGTATPDASAGPPAALTALRTAGAGATAGRTGSVWLGQHAGPLLRRPGRRRRRRARSRRGACRLRPPELDVDRRRHVPRRLDRADAAPPPAPPATDDLGLGRVVSDESRQRMLRPDGSFNVRRTGLGFWRSHRLYHDLVSMSWPAFTAVLGAVYAGFSAAFALGFWLLGPAALDAPATDAGGTGFLRALYFSVQTFATIGYGRIAPVSHGAQVLVAAEAFLGIFYAALATGFTFARVSRPTPTSCSPSASSSRPTAAGGA